MLDFHYLFHFLSLYLGGFTTHPAWQVELSSIPTVLTWYIYINFNTILIRVYMNKLNTRIRSTRKGWNVWVCALSNPYISEPVLHLGLAITWTALLARLIPLFHYMWCILSYGRFFMLFFSSISSVKRQHWNSWKRKQRSDLETSRYLARLKFE